MKQLINKLWQLPFEAFIYLIGFAVWLTLYLQIVVTPTAVFALISTISLNFLTFESASNVVMGATALGFVVGIYWAEIIRRRYSIFGFHSYLSGHPEIDGWQKPEQGIVFRQGNLVKIPVTNNE